MRSPIEGIGLHLAGVFFLILTRYESSPDDHVDTEEFGRLDGDEAKVDPALRPISTMPEEDLCEEEDQHHERAHPR